MLISLFPSLSSRCNRSYDISTPNLCHKLTERDRKYTELDFIQRKAHLRRTLAGSGNSLATTGTNFTKPGAQKKENLCTCMRAQRVSFTLVSAPLAAHFHFMPHHRTDCKSHFPATLLRRNETSQFGGSAEERSKEAARTFKAGITTLICTKSLT